MIVNTKDFRLECDHDPDPDLSYMDQEGFEEEKKAWENGELVCVYVRARIQLHFKSTSSLETITSPGLYGIVLQTVDMDDDPYILEVFEQECKQLLDMLLELGVDVHGTVADAVAAGS